MPIVINNPAKPVLLNRKLPYLRGLWLCLYTNDYEAPDNDTTESFDEATFPGYERQQLDDFGYAYLNAYGQGQSNTAQHVFLQTEDAPEESIYGYFVVDNNDYLIFSDKNANGPFVMYGEGATYIVIINFLEDTLRII